MVWFGFYAKRGDVWRGVWVRRRDDELRAKNRSSESIATALTRRIATVGGV